MTLSKSHVPARRALLRAAAALAAAPLVRILPAAHAEVLPHLSESDPAAKALKYHDDATAAPRTERAGTPPGEQFCHNCRFIQAESGEWRPCQIFPGKAVHETGWCASWTAKS